MKGYVKCIIAGAVILGIGIAVLIIALAVNGWKFDFKETEYEMKSYTAEQEHTTLNVDISAGEVEIVFYEGDKLKFDYPENNRFTASVTETENSIYFISKKKYWFDWFNWLPDCPKTTISIPNGSKINLILEMNAGSLVLADGEFENLSLELNAGNITANSVTASTVKCEVNAGAITLKNAACDKSNFKVNAGSIVISKLDCGEITADTNAGKITLGVAGTATEYTVQIEKNAGSCNVENSVGDSGKSIKGTMNAGTLEVTFLN